MVENAISVTGYKYVLLTKHKIYSPNSQKVQIESRETNTTTVLLHNNTNIITFQIHHETNAKKLDKMFALRADHEAQ